MSMNIEEDEAWGLMLVELGQHNLSIVKVRYEKRLEVGLKVIDRFGVYREVALIIEQDDDGNLFADLIDY